MKFCNYHVTTLFIGRNKKKILSENYKAFHAGKEHSVTLVGLLFVPGKIMTAVV